MDHGLEVSGVFFFDAAGEITRFFTAEHYPVQTPWPRNTDIINISKSSSDKFDL
jgi:hypothetical protein